jgi:hypothetical protein
MGSTMVMMMVALVGEDYGMGNGNTARVVRLALAFHLPSLAGDKVNDPK